MISQIDAKIGNTIPLACLLEHTRHGIIDWAVEALHQEEVGSSFCPRVSTIPCLLPGLNVKQATLKCIYFTEKCKNSVQTPHTKF